MCTVSWLRRADGYLLLCNRDERNTRRPAAGPRIDALNGISFIAPVDGDHGGSWIGVNEFGLTLCLLNRYGDWTPQPDQDYTSRGLLLIDLLNCSSREEVQRRISRQRLERFQPFTLAVLTVEESTTLDWTGREHIIQTEADLQVPLVSSSWKEPKIARTRKELFSRMVSEAGGVDAQLLDEFHRSHFPEPGPLSVCMHRADAMTLSLCAVHVKRNTIEFTYYPDSPCLQAMGEKVGIERKKSDELHFVAH
jgi:uncharacterized protein with NRDE domain